MIKEMVKYVAPLPVLKVHNLLSNLFLLLLLLILQLSWKYLYTIGVKMLTERTNQFVMTAPP